MQQYGSKGMHDEKNETYCLDLYILEVSVTIKSTILIFSSLRNDEKNPFSVNEIFWKSGEEGSISPSFYEQILCQ